MEIYSFVDYDKKRKVSVPSFLGKRKKGYSSGVKTRPDNFFSFDKKTPVYKPSRVERRPKERVSFGISVRLMLSKVGRAVTQTTDIIITHKKNISIALVSLIMLAGLITGGIYFYLYQLNHVSELRIETDNTDQINALMSDFVSENYGEYAENGDLLGEEAVSDFSFIQPVSYQNYTVRSGDTISGITKRFGLYNISTLISVNNISNARSLYVGKKLIIPSYDGIVYTVGKNDSLESIAKKQGISVESIVDSNELVTEILQSGQVLFLPGAKMDSTALKSAMGEVFMLPLKIKYRVSSEYGYRLYPLTGTPSSHSGIDLACATGTPIYAAKSGKVSFTGYSRVYGNYVIINHDNGYQTLYAHMSKITCVKGQVVDNNSKIGLVGSTGQSTGPHLHFTVFKNGSHINPRTLLKF